MLKLLYSWSELILTVIFNFLLFGIILVFKLRDLVSTTFTSLRYVNLVFLELFMITDVLLANLIFQISHYETSSGAKFLSGIKNDMSKEFDIIKIHQAFWNGEHLHYSDEGGFNLIPALQFNHNKVSKVKETIIIPSATTTNRSELRHPTEIPLRYPPLTTELSSTGEINISDTSNPTIVQDLKDTSEVSLPRNKRFSFHRSHSKTNHTDNENDSASAITVETAPTFNWFHHKKEESMSGSEPQQARVSSRSSLLKIFKYEM
ncbi:uncharacterized protein RJT20DRAFT_39214 [Scheffersomyces xylosifermentans]|uniref:uncharacterized protein n=1 Tax=Scheffersomyces xylosifermentans TaxID=1304137 RepID=UPI00315D9E39